MPTSASRAVAWPLSQVTQIISNMYEKRGHGLIQGPSNENLIVLDSNVLIGKKLHQKSRNSRRLSGGDVGAQGQLTWASNGLSPGTKYKRSKNDFSVTSIALSLEHHEARLLELSVQPVIITVD